jgi:hypothetical protein
MLSTISSVTKRHSMLIFFVLAYALFAVLALVGILMAWFKVIPLSVFGFYIVPTTNVTETGTEARRAVIQQKEAGYDVILLSRNPLEDVTYTQERLGVMVRGQWFTQAELDGLVDEFVATY